MPRADGTPDAPGADGSPSARGTPDAPGTTPTGAGAAADSTVGTGGGEGGSGAIQSGAPNMFGDAFGSRTVTFARTTSVPRFVAGLLIADTTFNTGGALVPPGRVGFVRLVNGPDPFFLAVPGVIPIALAPGQQVPLTNQQPFITSNLTPPQPGASPFTISQGQAIIRTVDTGGGGGLPFGEADVTYLENVTTVVAAVSTPTGGGVVGRTKVSEDNNPLPRDRYILNYDYFNHAALGGGIDVHRISAGFERTFFDQNASIEVRVPFASTMDPNIVGDGVTSRAAQLGNVNITLKALAYRGESLVVGGGVAVGLPTGSDVRVGLSDGTDLIRVRNEAYVATPFVAALYAPDDRFFAQVWGAWGFDANGNATEVNTGLAGMQRVGRITDQNLAQIDAQVGYWVYRAADRSATLQGLSPFVELHYNATVGEADVIAAGAYQVGTLGSLNELNLSVGANVQIGTNFLLSAGLVVPLRDNFDRTFDYQLGIRGNLFFGPTARSREAAARVSTF